MQIDDPPTRPGFITALDDAYLMPREDGYAVFWRTSGHDLCTVEADVAERALRRQGKVVRLGTWSGTLRGRADDWTLWWARGVPWASTSDVAGGEDVPAAHRALAGGAGARAGPRPALGAAAAGVRAPPIGRRRGRAAASAPRLLGGLRALFRAQLAPARGRGNMIAVIAGGDEDPGTDVREKMTRSAARCSASAGSRVPGCATSSPTAPPRAARSTTTSPAARPSSPARPCATRPARWPARWATPRATAIPSRCCTPGSTTGALRCERSDFRAGSAVLAVAAEPEEQTGARAAAAAAFEDWADAFAATLHGAGVKRKKAARLATLTVSAIEGAVVVSRARGDTLALDHVARELEAAIEAARGS